MRNQWSGKNRESNLTDMEQTEFDLLVIGGGITGAGIALDAQARGMRTALVEMQDFAAGTSSRSTKLVHGGLRYLKQFEVKLVAEVGKERAIVYENGPHVTTPEWMLLPIYQGGTFGRWSTSLGLRVYDYLAGVKKQERRKMLNSGEAAEKEPLLKREGLKGGGYYVEYRTDDARLTIEVLKEAVGRGCRAMNYLQAEEFVYEGSRLAGIVARDRVSGKSYRLRAHVVVNAAGPWVDGVRERDGSRAGKTLQLTKGVHLVFDQSRFPLRQAVYFDTPDGRMVFAIPRDGKTYVGTTDTAYDGDLANPRMTAEDRGYLIRAVNDMFPELSIKIEDVESSWAGLRPLIREEGKGPSEISRKDEIWESPTGLVTIAGGKLTGYRKMAETIVDLVADRIANQTGKTYTGCVTKKMPISGGAVGGSGKFDEFVSSKTSAGVKAGFSLGEAERLARRYGSNVERVYERYADYTAKTDRLGMPADLFASLLYGLEEELVMTPEDFFVRRTGALYFDRATVVRWKGDVLSFMGAYFGWSEEEKAEHSKSLERSLSDAIVAIEG